MSFGITYSVITACLNSAGTIRKSIDSVLSQEILPAEYIFIDGGSADGTLQIIGERASFAKENNFKTVFKIINQEEKTGITGAWNLGLNEAGSDLVFILNSDDWYEPGAVTEVLNGFKENPAAEIIYGSIFFHSGKEKFVRNCRPLWMFPLMMPIAHPSCFVRKSVYSKAGFFEEKYRISADYDFLYRCRRKGIKFCKIRKVLVNMELGGTANKNRVTARKETLNIAREYSSIPLLPELAYFARMLGGR